MKNLSFLHGRTYHLLPLPPTNKLKRTAQDKTTSRLTDTHTLPSPLFIKGQQQQQTTNPETPQPSNNINIPPTAIMERGHSIGSTASSSDDSTSLDRGSVTSGVPSSFAPAHHQHQPSNDSSSSSSTPGGGTIGRNSTSSDRDSHRDSISLRPTFMQK